MITLISLGAGVQSSAMALMAAHGEITPMPDGAIFADTQSEPKPVYRHLDWLETRLPFPVYRVTAGSLRDEILGATRGEQRMDARPPFYVENGGMLKRQCTQDYKLLVIERQVRALLGLKKGVRWPNKIRVEQWIGFSIDEASRMKPAVLIQKRHGKKFAVPHPTIKIRWPLIERDVSRVGCLSWMTSHGYPDPPKSACTFCPYHDDAMWARMQRDDPESFAEAVEVDAAIRNGVKDRQNMKPLSTAKWYVHRSLIPLDQVSFVKAKDTRQPNMFENECEGVCGV